MTSTTCRVHALYVANQDLIPSFPYGPLRTVKSSECRVRGNTLSIARNGPQKTLKHF